MEEGVRAIGNHGNPKSILHKCKIPAVWSHMQAIYNHCRSDVSLKLLTLFKEVRLNFHIFWSLMW